MCRSVAEVPRNWLTRWFTMGVQSPVLLEAPEFRFNLLSPAIVLTLVLRKNSPEFCISVIYSLQYTASGFSSDQFVQFLFIWSEAGEICFPVITRIEAQNTSLCLEFGFAQIRIKLPEHCFKLQKIALYQQMRSIKKNPVIVNQCFRLESNDSFQKNWQIFKKKDVPACILVCLSESVQIYGQRLAQLLQVLILIGFGFVMCCELRIKFYQLDKNKEVMRSFQQIYNESNHSLFQKN
ncbi:Hypothetical_protein [Hexamita inflata]|uniref:Hypothetical_protein n=1 Tax=Hexamita inflata TaxID=28002 RepID=A0ABP1HC79_9EUKA